MSFPDSLIYIAESEAEAAIHMPEAIETVREAYRSCAAGTFRPGDRIVQSVGSNQHMGQWLTAISSEPPIFGTKFSADFPDNYTRGLPNVRSVIELYSSTDGSQLAILEANYLTALKTGAGAAVATDLLARKDAESLGIIGTGIQAFTQVMAIQEVRKLSALYIYDMSRDRMEQFAERVRPRLSETCEIVLCDTAEECVSRCDILCTATPSRSPVFDGKALQPGTHVNAIGSFTPDMQEIDASVVKRAACIFTEHTEGLWAAAGDILIPLKQGLITRDVVSGSIADLLTGTVPGRQNSTDITLYESVGSCVLDMAIAIAVYEKSRKE